MSFSINKTAIFKSVTGEGVHFEKVDGIYQPIIEEVYVDSRGNVGKFISDPLPSECKGVVRALSQKVKKVKSVINEDKRQLISCPAQFSLSDFMPDVVEESDVDECFDKMSKFEHEILSDLLRRDENIFLDIFESRKLEQLFCTLNYQDVTPCSIYLRKLIGSDVGSFTQILDLFKICESRFTKLSKSLRRHNSKILKLCNDHYQAIESSPSGSLDQCEEQIFDFYNSCKDTVKDVGDAAKSFEANSKSLNDTLSATKDYMSQIFDYFKNDEVAEAIPFYKSILNHVKTNITQILFSAKCLMTSTSIIDSFGHFSVILGLLGLSSLVHDRVKDIFNRIVYGVKEQSSTLKLFTMIGSLLTKHVPSLSNFSFFHLVKEHKALLEIKELLEELLAEWGIYESDRMKDIGIIKNKVVGFVDSYTHYEALFHAKPTAFYVDKTYKEFKKVIISLDAVAKQFMLNKFDPSSTSALRQTVLHVKGKFDTLNSMIREVRDGDVLRVEPVALVFLGKPGIGKSKFVSKFVNTLGVHKSLLADYYVKHQLDEDSLYEEIDVPNWSIWAENFQENSDFADGYYGQEIHCADDVFQAASNCDHQRWINYISPQKFLTNQAALESKGRPYTSKLIVTTCNQFPTISKTINDITALQRRFIVVDVTATASPPADYDPTFAHLKFNVYKTGIDYVNRVNKVECTTEKLVEYTLYQLREKVRFYKAEAGFDEEQIGVERGSFGLLKSESNRVTTLHADWTDMERGTFEETEIFKCFRKLKFVVEGEGEGEWTVHPLIELIARDPIWKSSAYLCSQWVNLHSSSEKWLEKCARIGFSYLRYNPKGRIINLYSTKGMCVGYEGDFDVTLEDPEDEEAEDILTDEEQSTYERCKSYAYRCFEKVSSIFSFIVGGLREYGSKFATMSYDVFTKLFMYISDTVLSMEDTFSFLKFSFSYSQTMLYGIIGSVISMLLFALYYYVNKPTQMCARCEMLSRKVHTIHGRVIASNHDDKCDVICNCKEILESLRTYIPFHFASCNGFCSANNIGELDLTPYLKFLARYDIGEHLILKNFYALHKDNPVFDRHFEEDSSCSMRNVKRVKVEDSSFSMQGRKRVNVEDSSFSLIGNRKRVNVEDSSFSGPQTRKRVSVEDSSFSGPQVRKRVNVEGEEFIDDSVCLDVVQEEILNDQCADEVFRKIMYKCNLDVYRDNGGFGGRLKGLFFGRNVITPAHFHRGEGFEYYFYHNEVKVNMKLIHVDRSKDVALWSFIGDAFPNLVLDNMVTLNELNTHLNNSPGCYLNLSRDGSHCFSIVCVSYVADYTVDVNLEAKTYSELIKVKTFDLAAPPTRAGDCGGALVMMNPKSRGKVIGFHVLGGRDATYGAILYREYVDNLLKLHKVPTPIKEEKFVEEADNECCEEIEIMSKPYCEDNGDVDILNFLVKENPRPFIESDGDVQYVANLEKAQVLTTKTDLTRHALFGAFPVTKKPATLLVEDVIKPESLKTDSRGVPSILKTQVFKYASELPEVEGLKDDLADMTDQLSELFISEMNGYDISEMTEVEALSGRIEYNSSEPLDMRTTAGIPWSGLGSRSGKKKGNYVTKSVAPSGRNIYSIDRSTPHGQALADVVTLKEKYADKGMRTISLWKNCLKDETRPIHKVESGSTRLFTAVPMETAVVARKCFGKFKEIWQSLGTALFHSVGINPVSTEWTTLANKLSSKGSDFYDADFTQFDGRLRADFMEAAGDIVINTICTLSDSSRTKLRVIWSEFIQTYQVSRSEVHLVKRGNPSGNPMTTVVNCIVNLLYHWYCYRKITGRLNLNAFKKEVFFTCFGDDVIYSTNSQLTGYSFEKVSKIMEQLGQVYTVAAKDGSVGVSKKLSDITFLKRRFVEYGSGRYLSPIDTESIEQQFNYTNVGPKDFLTIDVQITEALISAAAHGRNYYDYVRTALTGALQMNSFLKSKLGISLPNYSESRDVLLTRTEQVANQCDFIKMRSYTKQYSELSAFRTVCRDVCEEQIEVIDHIVDKAADEVINVGKHLVNSLLPKHAVETKSVELPVSSPFDKVTTDSSEIALPALIRNPGESSARVTTIMDTPSGKQEVIHLTQGEPLKANKPLDFMPHVPLPEVGNVWGPLTTTNNDVNPIRFNIRTYHLMKMFKYCSTNFLFRIVAKPPLFSTKRYWVSVAAYDAGTNGALITDPNILADGLGFEWNPSEQNEIFVAAPWRERREYKPIETELTFNLQVSDVTSHIFASGLASELNVQFQAAPLDMCLYGPVPVYLSAAGPSPTLDTISIKYPDDFSAGFYEVDATQGDLFFFTRVSGAGNGDYISFDWNVDGGSTEAIRWKSSFDLVPGCDSNSVVASDGPLFLEHIESTSFEGVDLIISRVRSALPIKVIQDVCTEQVDEFVNTTPSSNAASGHYGSTIAPHSLYANIWDKADEQQFTASAIAGTVREFAAPYNISTNLGRTSARHLISHFTYGSEPVRKFVATSVPSASALFRIVQYPANVQSLTQEEVFQLPGVEWDPKSGPMFYKPYWDHNASVKFSDEPFVRLAILVVASSIATEPIIVTEYINYSDIHARHPCFDIALIDAASKRAGKVVQDVCEEQEETVDVQSPSFSHGEMNDSPAPQSNIHVAAPVALDTSSHTISGKQSSAESRYSLVKSFAVPPGNNGFVLKTNLKLLPRQIQLHARGYAFWRGIPKIKLVFSSASTTPVVANVFQVPERYIDIVNVDPVLLTRSVPYLSCEARHGVIDIEPDNLTNYPWFDVQDSQLSSLMSRIFCYFTNTQPDAADPVNSNIFVSIYVNPENIEFLNETVSDITISDPAVSILQAPAVTLEDKTTSFVRHGESLSDSLGLLKLHGVQDSVKRVRKNKFSIAPF